MPFLGIGLSAGLPALSQLRNGVPLGYVRLLVFDRDSALVGSQTQQLSAAAGTGYEPLQVQIIAPQDGYVTAYVGNDSDADVFFDDVTVVHGQGLQVQETEYDPTGLELAGVGNSTPGLKRLNQYKFNGKEFQTDLGLNWNHQDWRFFDTQLMRWHVVDPELENGQESWTPYSFSYDNAVRFNDTNGRKPGDDDPNNLLSRAGRYVISTAKDAVVERATNAVNGVKKDLTKMVEGVTPYFTAEGKFWVGLRLAAEVKGVGLDVGQSEEKSIAFQVDKKGPTVQLRGTRDGALQKNTIVGKLGVPTQVGGLEVSAKQSREISPVNGRVQTKSAEVGAGVSPFPSVLVGVGASLSKDYRTGATTREIKTEVSHGGSFGILFGLEWNVAGGVKYSQTKD